MYRATLLAALLGAFMLAGAASAQAAVSLNNPYRSFNSGVNYGAQQWERAHHQHYCHGRQMVRHR